MFLLSWLIAALRSVRILLVLTLSIGPVLTLVRGESSRPPPESVVVSLLVLVLTMT